MLVKSKLAVNEVNHLTEMFNVLRKYQMKLNPLKCAFGVASRKIFRFMVDKQGIEANPQKIQVLLEMTS